MADDDLTKILDEINDDFYSSIRNIRINIDRNSPKEKEIYKVIECNNEYKKHCTICQDKLNDLSAYELVAFNVLSDEEWDGLYLREAYSELLEKWMTLSDKALYDNLEKHADFMNDVYKNFGFD